MTCSTLRIACPASTSESTLLKALWTAQHYNNVINVELSRNACPDDKLFHLQVDDNDSPSSIKEVSCPSEENALAWAVLGLCGCSSNKQLEALERIQLDEWCEWERTVLRPCIINVEGDDDKTKTSKTKSLEKALHHLHSLGTSPHLFHHSDTLADFVVVSTLSHLFDATTLFPTNVAAYYKAHETALASAQAMTKKRLEALDCDYDKDDVSMFAVLHSVFGAAIQNLFGADFVKLFALQHFCSKCLNPKHGDYQCNAAMKIFGMLKQQQQTNNKHADLKSSQQVAQALADAIGSDHAVVMNLEVNGPGYILFRIRPSFLEEHMNHLLRHNGGKLVLPTPPKQVCLVDFSSPNIAKEMHVGHLRSTIIGEAVCRILEAVGHKVHRVNHVGDWGTQFGMLIQYLVEEYPDVANNTHAELPNITDLTGFYKSAKERFDENEEFKEKSRTNVVRLQSGDAQCLAIWKLLCDISRAEFHKVYLRLDVTTTECGESFYNDRIAPVINEFAKANLLKDEDGGAKVVFVDKFKVPLMLQKSDGGYGYDSTDMAALKYRLHELKAERIIIITDFSQADHFKMVYAAGHDIGWLDKNQKLEHIGFGTVQGDDGKRFKTRSGDTVRLVDLLDEAVNRMEASLTERIAEGKANITLEEVHGVAEAIGYGAVKYYDLRRNPTSNYKFSYDQMLDTKGDTAVYLMYARVRLESIMTKAREVHNVDVLDLLKNHEQVVLGNESERNLALSLHVFADVIEQTLEDLYPCRVCEFVYKLSNCCSDFITQCKVLGSPEMKSRLLLCHLSAMAMDQCFDLLGIRQVKRI